MIYYILKAVLESLTLNTIERDKIIELRDLLDNLNVATNILQSDKVNIPRIIVTIRNLVIRLKKINMRHLNNIRNELIDSIKERFD